MDIAATRTLPAPTRRMGPPRRRSFVTVVDGQVVIGPDAARAVIAGSAAILGLGIALAVSACVGARPAALPAIDPSVSGRTLVSAVADGPPIECRELADDRCLGAGSIEGAIAGVPVGRIERVVVSCAVGTCTAAGGAMRVDLVLRDGSVVEVARGGYGAAMAGQILIEGP